MFCGPGTVCGSLGQRLVLLLVTGTCSVDLRMRREVEVQGLILQLPQRSLEPPLEQRPRQPTDRGSNHASQVARQNPDGGRLRQQPGRFLAVVGQSSANEGYRILCGFNADCELVRHQAPLRASARSRIMTAFCSAFG